MKGTGCLIWPFLVLSWLQTLDEQEIYTEEELEQFGKQYEEKRKRFFEDGHVQPGEINVSF